MKPLVVGQNPGNRTFRKKDDKPNTGSSIGRLYQWMTFLGIDTYSFTNVSSKQGKVTKKDIDYDSLKSMAEGYDKVVALGGFASDALSKIGIDHFKLPHPSGLNRQLNDKAFVDKVLYECKKYMFTFQTK
tara:strand:+ start:266 stop:655 length:390 start_codon:yes stop_codon:yes gene_type:complete